MDCLSDEFLVHLTHQEGMNKNVLAKAQSHLKGCEGCRRRFADYKKFIRDLCKKLGRGPESLGKKLLKETITELRVRRREMN